MSKVLRTEIVMLPLQTSAGGPRRDREGRVIEPAPHELHPAVFEVVEPDEATKARRRMLAAQRAVGMTA